MNNYQVLLNIAFTVAGFLAAFILNAIWKKISDLESADNKLVTQINAINVNLATLR